MNIIIGSFIFSFILEICSSTPIDILNLKHHSLIKRTPQFSNGFSSFGEIDPAPNNQQPGGNFNSFGQPAPPDDGQRQFFRLPNNFINGKTGLLFDITTRRFPSRRTTTTTPRTSSTTIAVPGNATPPTRCELACLLTPEYNPVCGDNRMTYTNPATLKCAQSCGKRVRMTHYGACVDRN